MLAPPGTLEAEEEAFKREKIKKVRKGAGMHEQEQEDGVAPLLPACLPLHLAEDDPKE